MKLTHLGTDPESGGGNCPNVWETDETYIFQGNKVTDPAVLAEAAARDGGLPEHETLVEVPKHLVHLFILAPAGDS